MRASLAAGLLLAIGLAGTAPLRAAPFKGQLYPTEQRARWECRGDEVVWVDPPTGRWFRKGSGWYDDTENGGYACRRAVEPDTIPVSHPPVAGAEPGTDPGAGPGIDPTPRTDD